MTNAPGPPSDDSDPGAPKSDDDLPSKDDIGEAAKAAALLGVVFAGGALAFVGPRAAWSVLVGAGIAVANLLTMRAIVRALVSGTSRARAAWGIFAVLKIFLFFGGVGLLLTRHVVDPMPLVVGYGVLPLSLVVGAIRSDRQRRGG